ncbi:PTS transporter subunit EIIC, partial [Corynebacterium sp.]|uniref:PTS transporter subunit EIIC n=1 Tax=Corynebacterium sp. TaxID=1720 RepID=UPI0026E00F18
DLDGVIDVVKAGGQYQVVIGPEVENVYNAIEAQLGPTDDAPAEVREKPTTAVGWIKYGFSELIGVITGSMIPIIGLLAASGIIKGILSLLLTFDVITDDSNTYQIINAMSDAVFFFLPIFVGYTAAKRLGADPIIVAIIGGVLTYPTLVEMSQSGADNSILGMPLNSDFFGIPFHVASYSYSIFPIIVAAWVASIVEPWLKKVIPAILRMIFVPLFEVIIVSVVILLVLGPIVMFVSTGIANVIQGLYDLSPTISGAVIGAFYQSLVIFGLHWAVIPLVAQDIAASGNSYLNAIISSTMVAQGGAVLAVFVKTKLDKIKALSGPAAISAFCGITEPAMYGVNLKYGRVFIMASIGGFVGGLLTGLFNVNMWGFTGSLIGFTSFVNPEGLDFSFWGFLIASAAALGTAFVLTWFFGFKDSDVDAERTVKKVRLGRRDPVAK